MVSNHPPADRTTPQRVSFRVDAQTKALIDQAAALQHRSLADFCLATLADAAHKTIAAHQSPTLAHSDRAVFFDMLATPPASSDRLRRAFASYHGKTNS